MRNRILTLVVLVLLGLLIAAPVAQAQGSKVVTIHMNSYERFLDGSYAPHGNHWMRFENDWGQELFYITQHPKGWGTIRASFPVNRHYRVWAWHASEPMVVRSGWVYVTQNTETLYLNILFDHGGAHYAGFYNQWPPRRPPAK